MDWAHLHPRADWPNRITKRQNRIRLHELRALTERFFEIERWEPRRSLPDEGANGSPKRFWPAARLRRRGTAHRVGSLRGCPEVTDGWKLETDAPDFLSPDRAPQRFERRGASGGLAAQFLDQHCLGATTPTSPRAG